MYNNATIRIGNWIEDIAMDKETILAFIKKRQEEKLLVQHTRRLLNNLLRETRLSKNDGYLKFGNCIQLKAPDMPGCPPPFGRILDRSKNAVDDGNENCEGVVITGTIHDKHINETSSGLINDCCMIASPILVPSIRNSFVIESADHFDRTTQQLLFGQEFTLRSVDSTKEPLYVRAETPLVDDPRGPLEHNPVRLSNKKDVYSIWKILHWDKEMRFESEGAPFVPFTRIVVRHLMSGLDLAVEGTVWWQSIFGTECGLSVHTYTNNMKRESAECLWTFVTRTANAEF